MPKSALSAPFFHDEAAAFAKLESLLWPTGPVCPHCGAMGRITAVKGGRMGLRRCGDCKKQFTVKVGTVFEASHVKLHLWLQATHLLCSSKKGFSAHQLHRTLGVTYRTAWFMAHRLREAMRDGSMPVMGGPEGVVEVDETYVGGKPRTAPMTFPRRRKPSCPWSSVTARCAPSTSRPSQLRTCDPSSQRTPTRLPRS